jgi:serine/threonine-protein kinase SRPK3
VLICIDDVESIIQAELAASANATTPPTRLVGVPPSRGRGGNQTPRSESVFITGSQPLPSPSSSFGPSPVLDKWAFAMSKIEDAADGSKAGSLQREGGAEGGRDRRDLSEAMDQASERISQLQFDKHGSGEQPKAGGPSLLSQQAPGTATAGADDGAKPPSAASTASVPPPPPPELPPFDITERITVKIADLGNATWVEHHFTDDIQTRQYRCPEVLLGARWGPSADIWSVACVVRAPLYVCFLREADARASCSSCLRAAITCSTRRRAPATPRTRTTSRRSSSSWASCRTPSRSRASTATASSTARVRRRRRPSPSLPVRPADQSAAGELRHINKLRFWPREDVLHDKYEFSREIALTIASFLTPMLRLHPEKRAGAGELAHHRWLDGVTVQGEIDVLRRAEHDDRARRPADTDALKPVEDAPAPDDDERAPPKLSMPKPASAAAKENAAKKPPPGKS